MFFLQEFCPNLNIWPLMYLLLTSFLYRANSMYFVEDKSIDFAKHLIVFL